MIGRLIPALIVVIRTILIPYFVKNVVLVGNDIGIKSGVVTGMELYMISRPWWMKDVCHVCHHKDETKNLERHSFVDASGNNDYEHNHKNKCPNDHTMKLYKVEREYICEDCGVHIFRRDRDRNGV